MLPHIAELAQVAQCAISAHPNAGLPNALGEYDQTPDDMLLELQSFCEQGLLNILGGCCGTTPEHIAAMHAMLQRSQYVPRQHQAKPDSSVNSKQQPACCLSGLEPLVIKPDSLFVNIGERTNVSGSKKFLRLIKEKDYTTALEIAHEQVENGAQLIDVNLDDGLLDGKQEMIHFLNLLASEPAISRVPVVIDSSKWEVLEAGLQCIQGKGVVNSI